MQMTKTKAALMSIITVIVILAFFCLTACSNKFDYECQFSQDSINLSVGEEFNPNDYISADNELSFVSDNEQVLSLTEQQTFVAQQSGRAVVSAYDGDMFIDAMEVYVKYKFLTPTNLKVTNDGVLTWDKSDITVNGESVAANYELQISLNGEQSLVQAQTNSYRVEQAGEYTVSVRALSGENVDASNFSSGISFYFDLTQGATNLTVESSSEFGSQQATISWAGVGDGILAIDGVQREVSGGQHTYDFTYFDEGENIEVRLVLTSAQGQSKTLTQTVQKLTTPQISVSGESLSWQGVEGAEEYVLNVTTPTGENATEFRTQDTSSILPGMQEGVYRLTYQAMAQQGYLNGNQKLYSELVGKVKNVEADVEIVDGRARITFSTNSPYNKRFIVRQNNLSFTFEFTGEAEDGVYTLTQEFDLFEGENVFTVQAVPTLENGLFGFEGYSTSQAVMSDEERICDVYYLAQITNLQHSLDEEGNSILQFDDVENANAYIVKVNDIEVQDVQVSNEAGKTVLNIGKITKEAYGETQQFNIEITATRTPVEGEEVSPSVAQKLLTMLECPTMQNLDGGLLEQTQYQWNAVNGAEYVYNIYETDETFNTAEIQPQTFSTSQNISQQLDAGYYVIEVKSWPVDENNYLPSEEYGSDTFYVSQQLASAPIRLDYSASVAELAQNSGYVLSIQTVEFAYGYIIKVNGSEVGRVFNDTAEAEVLSFNFPAAYDFGTNGEQYSVEVEAYAQTDAQQIIHTNSTSLLTVNRLAMPTEMVVEEGDTVARVVNSDDLATMTIQKDGADLITSEAGQDGTVSVSGYDGDFQIRARLNGYEEFEGFTTAGTINLESAFATFVFHRSQTPTMLNYSQQQVSFTHNDKVTVYHVDITVSSQNGSISRYFETQLTTFNLEDEIAELRANDAVFDSYFSQRTEVTIKVYADISLSEDGVYYLPSRYATLRYDSSSTDLVISKLDSVKLSYNEQTQIISWQGVSQQNPEYLVYLGDELQQTITAPAQSGLYEFSVAEYDFLQPGDYNFYVIAKSDNTLQADASASIIFHKISSVSSLRVFRQGQDYYASFEIGSADANYVTDILVNNSSIGTSPQFKLDANTVSVVLKGTTFEQDGDQIYFVSSTPSQFDVAEVSLSTYQANATIQNNNLIWDDFSPFVADWLLASPSNNLRYEVVILDAEGEVQRTISSLSTNSLQLTNSQLVNLINGDYTASIYAYIDEYNLSVQGKGYWGITLLADSVNVKKLDSATNLTASIDASQTTIDAELQKSVNLAWQFNGSSTSQVTFEIYLNNSLIGSTTATTYQIAQNLFTEQQNTLKVVATSSTDIMSGEVSVSVGKFSPLQISVSDRGLLTITDNSSQAAQQGYIVELTIKAEGGDVVQTYYVSQTNADIQQFIAGQSGAFTLRVSHKATQAVTLPSQEVASFNGRILAQPQIIQDETGLSFTSTDSDVTFHLRCEEKDFETQIDGNHFNFPEDWESGVYTITVYATREGAVDSWQGQSAQKQITITRIDNVSQITADRTADYLDHVLSWDAIDDAAGYQIEVIENGEVIATLGELTQNSVNLSQMLTLQNGGGNYTIKFKTLADYSSTGLTNSHEFTFNISVAANTISNIQANTSGLLQFEAQSVGTGIYLDIKDAEGNAHKGAPIILTADERTFLVEELTGQLQITLRQLSVSASQQIVSQQNSTLTIDAAVQTAAIYKLQDIISISADAQTGKLMLNVAAETGQRRFYVKVVDESGLQTVVEANFTSTSSVNFEMLAIELCEMFPLTDGETFDFTIYSVIDGMLRSDEASFQFTYRASNGTVVQAKLSETEDYIVIKDNGTNQIENNITAIHVRNGGGPAGTHYEIDIADVQGYWITHTYMKDGQEVTEQSFSYTNITGEGYTSVPCYAINITNLLENMNASAPAYLQVGYITTQADDQFIVNGFTQSMTYTKLSGPTNFTIDEGNLSWQNSAGANTGFVISLENQTGTNQIFISASNATYYLGENITYVGEFEVALQAVSSQLGVLPSNKLYYEKDGERGTVRKLDQIDTALTISNGVMSLSFDDQREIPEQGDETAEEYIAKLDSLERRLAKSGEATIWTSANFASRLLEDVLKYPFDYNLEDLQNLEFNLKFINTQTQQEYVTSVSAIQLLARFDEATLETFNTVITSLNNNPYASRLWAVYNILTSAYYFNGVATSSLLFDEIGSGENGVYGKVSANTIPAGVYDIYIQQQGSQENSTLSSAYSLKQSGITIIASPQTIADEIEEADGSSQYIIKFRPVTNADGENYTDYTLVLKNKNTTIGENNIEYNSTATYNITFDGEVWTRTAYAEGGATTQQLQTDEEGFVLISINGKEDGLIYETGIVDIYGNTVELEGNDFTANVYVNGSDTALNSKTEEISVVFLQFNINSLQLQNGVFAWENFSVSNRIYSTTVLYKFATSNAQELTLSGQNPTLSFNNAGLYEYVTFYTQGSASDFSITVDSPTYTINNVYKLSAPNVRVVDGKFSIADSNAAFTAQEFLISNNVYQTDHEDMFALSTNRQDSVTYQTGVNSILSSQTARYELGLTERTANTFYFATSGDNFEMLDGFEIETESNNYLQGSDRDGYIITVNQTDDGYTNLYLQSATTSVTAGKLEMDDDISVTDGDVHWQSASGFERLSLADDLEIVYEVTVEYYRQTSSGWEASTQDTTTYYTTNTYLSADNIIDPVATEYRYAVYVKAHAYSPSANGTITTLEGERYATVNQSQYTDNLTFVLEGELYHTAASADELLQRAPQVENFQISNGKITWTYDGTAEFEVYIAEQARSTILNGTYSQEGGVYTFTLSQDAEQLSDNQTYNFSILAKQSGKITSNTNVMFESAQARILSVLEQTDFTTDQVESTSGGTLNSVDFSQYFTRSIISNKNYIALEVTADLGEEQFAYTITNASRVLYIQIGGTDEGQANTIYLPEGSEGVNIVVQPIPGATSNTILSAYRPTTISFSYVDWSEQDILYFDEQSQTFYWTYGVKFSDRTLGQTAIYTDDMGTPYGFVQGENLQEDQVFLDGETYVPVMYYVGQYNTYYVDIHDTYAVVEQDGTVRIYANQATDMFELAEDGTYQPSGLTMTEGIGYEFGASSWAVLAKMPFDDEQTTYYIPAELMQYQSDGESVTFTVLENTPLYVDEEASVVAALDDGVALEVNNYNAEAPYQEIVLGGETVYISTENVYHFLQQDESFSQNMFNMHFKVTIVTEYSYDESYYTYSVRDTREYNNVPLGSLQTQFGDYNVAEEGIYVSSFEPNLIGTIVEFSVQARKSQNNMLSSPLELSGEMQFDLFELGDGSESNPYQIANMQQFENISYRYEKQSYHNTYNRKLYVERRSRYSGSTEIVTNETSFTQITDDEGIYNFLQTQNLEMDVQGFVISQPFVGNYDGGGNTIDVTTSALSTLDTPITARISSSTGSQDVSFEQGAAVFKEIGAGSVVENLSISFGLTFNQTLAAQLGSGSALVGGLVLSNNGTVSSVEVTSSSVVFASAMTSAGTLAVAPIVAENRQVAREISSQADVSITNSFSRSAQNFMYGALVGFNNTTNGQILLAQNDGNISARFTNNQNGVVMASGIAISNVNAIIEMSVNNGDVTSVSTRGSAYAAGVTVHSYGGSIYHSANTGDIMAANAGGIIYNGAGVRSTGTVAMGRVNQAYNNLFASSATYTTDSGTNYTYAGYNPTLGLTYVRITTNTDINCRSSGYVLRVLYTSVENYSVQIVQN